MSVPARKPSARQVAGLSPSTRGMNKDARPFAEQITAGRDERHAYQSRARACVSCERPRTGTSPICDRCNGGRGV